MITFVWGTIKCTPNNPLFNSITGYIAMVEYHYGRMKRMKMMNLIFGDLI